MILLTFRHPEGLRLGIRHEGRVLDVSAAGAALGIPVPGSPEEFFARGLGALPELRRVLEVADPEAPYLRDEAGVRLGPAVPRPGKILCVGLNYRRHAAESGMEEPKQPVLFSKFGNAVAAPGEEIAIGGLEQVDYEAELGVVIGRRLRRASEAEALGAVLGYCNANDLSERRLQFLSGQWLLGKTLDGFLPVGPHLVTADEAGDPQGMAVRGWLNGELRQDSSTADMIFGVAEIIAYASRYMTLLPGDLICTGTPEGVVLGMEEKRWMRPGDEYAIEIGPLGRLANRMVEG